MKRLTYKHDDNWCIDGKSGKLISDVRANYWGEAIDKLAYYEDLEEQGRLIILSVEDIHPCNGCCVGWSYVSSDGYETCEETCERLKLYNKKYRT